MGFTAMVLHGAGVVVRWESNWKGPWPRLTRGSSTPYQILDSAVQDAFHARPHISIVLPGALPTSMARQDETQGPAS